MRNVSSTNEPGIQLSVLRAEGVKSLSEALPELSDEERFLEVDILLSWLLQLSRGGVFLAKSSIIEAEVATRVRELFSRRCNHEPLAYIIGRKEFFGLEFEVSPAVLIPRPETELLVEEALAVLGTLAPGAQVVEVGVGSGAVLLSLAHSWAASGGSVQSSFFGVDISRSALEVTQRNAVRLGVDAQLIQADLFCALKPDTASDLLVLANLPYIPDSERLMPDVENFEPHLALRGGADGLSLVFALVKQIRDLGRSPAATVLILEIGQGQDAEVGCYLKQLGFSSVTFKRDLQGINRICIIRE